MIEHLMQTARRGGKSTTIIHMMATRSDESVCISHTQVAASEMYKLAQRMYPHLRWHADQFVSWRSAEKLRDRRYRFRYADQIDLILAEIMHGPIALATLNNGHPLSGELEKQPPLGIAPVLP